MVLVHDPTDQRRAANPTRPPQAAGTPPAPRGDDFARPPTPTPRCHARPRLSASLSDTHRRRTPILW
jgi:hypothetical protein